MCSLSLFSLYSEAATDVFYKENCSLKFCSIHMETPFVDSRFNKATAIQVCNFIKRRFQCRFLPFIEASSTSNIHTGEKSFCSCHFYRFVGRIFSDEVRKLMAYFDLFQSFLHFQREEDETNTACERQTQFSICRYLV